MQAFFFYYYFEPSEMLLQCISEGQKSLMTYVDLRGVSLPNSLREVTNCVVQQ